MGKVKMVLSWWIPMVLITVALMTPAVAEAKSIKIWPDQMRPIDPTSYYRQEVSYVSNSSFYAPINVPVGARITKITLYHYGMGSPALTEIQIFRTKMDNVTEFLLSANSSDSTGQVVPVDLSLSAEFGTIRTGYRYFFRVTSQNTASQIKGVKITYQE